MNRSLYRLIVAILGMFSLAACSTGDAKTVTVTTASLDCATPKVNVYWQNKIKSEQNAWTRVIRDRGRYGNLTGVKLAIAQRDSEMVQIGKQMRHTLEAARLADSVTACK